MSRNQVRLAALGLFLGSLFVGWLAYNGGIYTVEITQQEAQERLNAALQKRAAQEKTFEVESVKVLFEQNQVRVHAKISGKVRNRVARTSLYGEGIPEYRNGSFYFHPTGQMRFSGIAVEEMETEEKSFPETKKFLRKKIKEYTTKYGFDGFDQTFKDECKEYVTRIIERHITVALSEYPLHTLEDAKGFAIKTALEKVEIVGDKLHITLSVVRFGPTVFVTAFLLVIAICLMFLLG